MLRCCSLRLLLYLLQLLLHLQYLRVDRLPSCARGGVLLHELHELLLLLRCDGGVERRELLEFRLLRSLLRSGGGWQALAAAVTLGIAR